MSDRDEELDKHSRNKGVKRAVALQYNDASELPRVLASGVDEVAKRIVELAEQHDIPIHQDEALANLLGKVDQGAPISRESYRLVAEVISFLYHMNKEWRESRPQLQALLGRPIDMLETAQTTIENPELAPPNARANKAGD